MSQNIQIRSQPSFVRHICFHARVWHCTQQHSIWDDHYDGLTKIIKMQSAFIQHIFLISIITNTKAQTIHVETPEWYIVENT